MRPFPGAGAAPRVSWHPEQLGIILAALVVAAIGSYLLTPLAIRIAHRTGAIDEPDQGRRVHRAPVPRAGGLAVATAFVVTGTIAWWIADSSGLFAAWVAIDRPDLRVTPDQVAGLQAITPGQVAALMGGVIVAAAFGFIDDRWQVRARWQLLEQLVLAGVAIAGAITISTLVNPFGFLGGVLGGTKLVLAPVPGELTAISALVTALWVVGMINSINFIDGLDGLSTGVTLIAAATLGIISMTGEWYNVEPVVALLCAALAGALAGFLPWNFNPARVFIGTTGVYAVGFALACLAILGTAKIAVALLVLGVPIIDTFWIIIRRVSAGRSPFTPDRGHFHHRLLDLGLSHRNAVLLIYALCGTLAATSIVLAESAGTLYAFVMIVVGGGLVLYLFSRRAQEALDARSYDDEDAEPSVATTSDTLAGPATGPSGDPGRPER